MVGKECSSRQISDDKGEVLGKKERLLVRFDLQSCSTVHIEGGRKVNENEAVFLSLSEAAAVRLSRRPPPMGNGTHSQAFFVHFLDCG